MNDKEIETNRYESRAKLLLDKNELSEVYKLPDYLNAPYLRYQKAHLEFINIDDEVLEIGAGIGNYTDSLLKTGAFVTATDISPSSLKIIKKKYEEFSDKLTVRIADIEALPFKDDTFDVVCSAGSLSYGENKMVMKEIFRVLKPGGKVIIVDSLHENPIYVLNRWLGYLKGSRSLLTIKNMPKLNLFKEYEIFFNLIRLEFFGSLIWLVPMLKIILKNKDISRVLDKADSFINPKRSAFKFVAVFSKSF